MKSAKMIKRVQRGFTLIELMIVVAIIGILAAVAIPAYQDYVTKAKVAKVAAAVKAVQTAVAQYAQENGGTIALGSADNWSSLGLTAAPTATTEVSSINLTTAGVITANLPATVVGTACSIGFTPTVGTTSVTWAVATPGAAGTACPAPIPAIIAKWN